MSILNIYPSGQTSATGTQFLAQNISTIQADDSTLSNQSSSQYLALLSFDYSSIPSGATINSLRLEYKAVPQLSPSSWTLSQSDLVTFGVGYQAYSNNTTPIFSNTLGTITTNYTDEVYVNTVLNQGQLIGTSTYYSSTVHNLPINRTSLDNVQAYIDITYGNLDYVRIVVDYTTSGGGGGGTASNAITGIAVCTANGNFKATPEQLGFEIIDSFAVGSQGVANGSGAENMYVGGDKQLHQLPASGGGGSTTNALSLNQVNGLQSVVNGVTASLPIPSGTLSKAIGYDSSGAVVYGNPASINSSSVQLASGFITTTVNGFGAAQPILTGTPVKILGFDANDLPITVTPASLGGGGGVVTNDLSSASNTMTSNVSGVIDTAPIINTNQIDISPSFITSNVNGIISARPILTGTPVKILGFDSSNIPITVTPASLGGGTDSQTLSLAGNTLSISNGNSVTLPSGGATYTFNDTNSIDLVTSGTTITGNVKRSTTANNSIVENGDGIYSPSTLSDLGNPSVIPQGVAAVMGVTDVLGKDLQWRTLPTVSGGGTDSQTLSIAGNTLSISNGNSVTLPSGGATTNSLTSSNFKLISNVNGVTSDLLPPSGTLFAALGFDSSGNMVRATPNFYLNKSFRDGGPPNGATQTYSQLDLGVGTYVSGGVLPSILGGLITLNNPYGVGVDMDFIIFPEQICSLAGFDTLPSGVNSAVGSCSIDFFDTGSGTWVEYAANVVNTTVRVSPPPPSGYSATTHAHDNWKSPYRISIAGGAFGPTQIQYRTRVQVYSGILASVYIWQPVFTVIGLIA